ncbi:MAG: hypothetical protein Kow0076_7510 [Francisella sp.]
MVSAVVSFCLLITPFILAFLHSSIIYKQHHIKIYANYFIASNITLFMLINSYAYLVDGYSISKFQGWIFTPAIFQIGIFELSFFLFSIIALFKCQNFKSACLIFFCIYTILNSLTLFNGSVYYSGVEAIFVINISSATISYILARLLSKSKKN